MPRRTILRIIASIAFMACLSFTMDAVEVPLRRMTITTWTTDQGLPQNFVRSIAQTEDGFIWVGSMDGLARFDGVRFRNFSRQGLPELDQSIVGLARDAGA